MEENEFDQFEKIGKIIEKANDRLMDSFALDLEKSGLAEVTINEHIGRIYFFLNHFLLCYEAIEAPAGISKIDEFLGEWFPRRANWSNPTSMKRNVATLKKFYAFLQTKGLVTYQEVAEMKQTIKTNLPQWIENVRLDRELPPFPEPVHSC